MNTTDDFLAHYGIKGMKWGVRRPNDAEGGSSRRHLSEGQKKALKIGAGLAVTAGAALTVSMMIKSGRIPVTSINPAKLAARSLEGAKNSPFTYYAGKARSASAQAGQASGGARYAKGVLNEEFSKLFDDDTWNTSVKALTEQIAEAHRSETKYMKTNSARSGMGYDPKLNRYTPESRALPAPSSPTKYRDEHRRSARTQSDRDFEKQWKNPNHVYDL